jgi:hypothetical protein
MALYRGSADHFLRCRTIRYSKARRRESSERRQVLRSSTKWDQLNCLDSVETISSDGNRVENLIIRQRFLSLYPGPYSATNSRDNVETIFLP